MEVIPDGTILVVVTGWFIILLSKLLSIVEVIIGIVSIFVVVVVVIGVLLFILLSKPSNTSVVVIGIESVSFVVVIISGLFWVIAWKSFLFASFVHNEQLHSGKWVLLLLNKSKISFLSSDIISLNIISLDILFIFKKSSNFSSLLYFSSLLFTSSE